MAGKTFIQDNPYFAFQNITGQITAAVGLPMFYVEKKEAVEQSRRIFDQNPVARDLLTWLKDHEDYPGHGLQHITKVARDAGALIILDGGGIPEDADLNRLIYLAHLAGILHDIKRSEPDHARRGAEEAGRILSSLDLSDDEIRAVVQAIANHEAFQPAQPLRRPSDQLLSDALYDGDKFRWGPDNFTDTLWAIVLSKRVELGVLVKYFPRGLEATEKIRNSFRTRTGKEYGPDFIDRGLEVGQRLYEHLKKSMTPT